MAIPEGRGRVRDYLDGIEFPAVLMDVERGMRANGASESLLEEIKSMAPDQVFDSPDEFLDATRDQIEES